MKIYFVSCPFLSVHQKVTWPCAFVNFSDLKVDLKIKGYCIESIENVQQWNFANAYHASDKLFYYTKPLSNQKSKIHWKSIARELLYLYVPVYVRLSLSVWKNIQFFAYQTWELDGTITQRLEFTSITTSFELLSIYVCEPITTTNRITFN